MTDLLEADDMTLESLSHQSEVRDKLTKLGLIEDRILSEGKVDRVTMESVYEIAPEAFDEAHPPTIYTSTPSPLNLEMALESISTGRLLLTGLAIVSVAAAFYIVYRKMKDHDVGKSIDDTVKENQKLLMKIKDAEEKRPQDPEDAERVEYQSAIAKISSGDLDFFGMNERRPNQEEINWMRMWWPTTSRDNVKEAYTQLMTAMSLDAAILEEAVENYLKLSESADDPVKMESIARVAIAQISRRGLMTQEMLERMKQTIYRHMGDYPLKDIASRNLSMVGEFVEHCREVELDKDMPINGYAVSETIKRFLAMEKTIKRIESSQKKKKKAIVMTQGAQVVIDEFKKILSTAMQYYGQAYSYLRVYDGFLKQVKYCNEKYLKSVMFVQQRLQSRNYAPVTPRELEQHVRSNR